WDIPVRGRRPTALPQHPCCICIFEPIDDVTENIIVLRKKVWPLMIAAAGSGPVRKSFEEIRIPVMREHRETPRGIIGTRSTAKLGQQRHWQKCNSHIVHRLVIATLGSDELA